MFNVKTCANIISDEKRILLFCILFIVLLNSPFVFLGDNFYLQFGNDSPDSNVIWHKLLVESGSLLSSNSKIIGPALGGLPRVCFPNELSLETILYYLFKPSSAYFINILFIQLVAFGGMIVLLKKLYSKEFMAAIYLVALSFSCLLFWPHAGISVAGLPLLIYSYLIVKEKYFLSIIIMLGYTLYSSMILTGMFLIIILLFVQAKNIIKGEFNKKQFLFTNLFLLFYLLTNYRLIWALIKPVFLSHRVDFVIPAFGIKDSLKTFIDMVFAEYGHNPKMSKLIILFALIYFVFFIFKKLRLDRNAIKIIAGILILSAISVLLQSKIVYSVYSKADFLKTIQLQRFYWLLPPLFYVLLFVIARDFVIRTKKTNIVFSILILQLVFVAYANFNLNWRQIIKTEILGRKVSSLTFHGFYSPELYREIKNYIGSDQSKYRVASLGLQPAAALYNGFYTIDGYFVNYPKKYKDYFYKIIESELNKNPEMKKFYVNWGSVCILLADEMIKKLNGKGYLIPTFYKDTKNVINELNIDTDVMRNLNCQYLFSAFKINNFAKLGMHFEKYFENTRSPYGVYLYSL